MASLYDVIGITPQFSSESIRRLRGLLAREYAESGRAPDPARMAAINAAIDVLGDDAARRAYDAEHGIASDDGARLAERAELEHRLASCSLDRNQMAVTIIGAAVFGVLAWWIGFVLVALVSLWWAQRAGQRAALVARLDTLSQDP